MKKKTCFYLSALLAAAFFASGSAHAVRCGDGYADLAAGEQCDDGNTVDGDGCSAACLLEPMCGDGVVDEGEACDDGNNINGDGCSASCTIEAYCGDGILNIGEACDDGNNIDGDGCSSECGIEPFCGDGNPNPGEQCDDGNNDNGDGCSALCETETANGEGCTPGYWKQRHHFDSWYSYSPDTLFGDMFEDAFPGQTLLEVLKNGGGKLKALGRHTVAALLNASSTDVNYGQTAAAIVDTFNTAYPGTNDAYESVKDGFEYDNERDCTLN